MFLAPGLCFLTFFLMYKLILVFEQKNYFPKYLYLYIQNFSLLIKVTHFYFCQTELADENVAFLFIVNIYSLIFPQSNLFEGATHSRFYKISFEMGEYCFPSMQNRQTSNIR